MIFVTLGNQNFEFKRLLLALENLIADGTIHEKVVIQCGHTKYKSDSFEIIDFLGKSEFNSLIEEARFVISHAGTGSIISCLKKSKKVIVAARLKEYGEHVDNHQKEILDAFNKKRLIIGLEYDLSDLPKKLTEVDDIDLEQFISNNKSFNVKMIKIIENLF